MSNLATQIKIDSKAHLFSDEEKPIFKTPKGLSKRVVETISYYKNEPEWMREKRLRGLQVFQSKSLPTWGADLSGLNFNEITYFIKPDEKKANSWKEVPPYIKKTFERLGIPQAERKVLAGLVAQYESESVYDSLKKSWEKKGVIFTDTDTALQKYPDLFKEYFMTRCVPIADHKFSALHAAVWSGGSFVYVPRGVKVEIPLQTYFRMNAPAFGQFEHTLIIAEEGAQVHYIEACTAPIYRQDSLHSAVVEIFVKKGAKVRYTTIQNWSKNVYNLNTKRAIVNEEGQMEWVGGSLGSKITMLYPASFLIGKGAKADHLNISIATKGQWKDTGAKVIHGAPYTSSNIVAKSIAKDDGRTSYRGLLRIANGAYGSKSSVRCDALMMGEQARSDTFPYMEVYENDAVISHEARVGRVGEEQVFYLQSRGLSETEATSLIVSGFLDEISKKLPLEYAVELNRLIELEMEGSIG